jgi:hypothetical protein
VRPRQRAEQAQPTRAGAPRARLRGGRPSSRSRTPASFSRRAFRPVQRTHATQHASLERKRSTRSIDGKEAPPTPLRRAGREVVEEAGVLERGRGVQAEHAQRVIEQRLGVRGRRDGNVRGEHERAARAVLEELGEDAMSGGCGEGVRRKGARGEDGREISGKRKSRDGTGRTAAQSSSRTRTCPRRCPTRAKSRRTCACARYAVRARARARCCTGTACRSAQCGGVRTRARAHV